MSDKSDDVELCDHIQFLITEVATSTKTTATESASTTTSNEDQQPVDETGDVVTDGEFFVYSFVG